MMPDSISDGVLWSILTLWVCRSGRTGSSPWTPSNKSFSGLVQLFIAAFYFSVQKLTRRTFTNDNHYRCKNGRYSTVHIRFLKFWKPQKVIHTRVRSNIWFDSTIFGNFNKFTQIHCLRTAAKFFGKVFYGTERKCVTWQWVWTHGFKQYCLVQCKWLPKPKPDQGAKGTSVFSKW